MYIFSICFPCFPIIHWLSIILSVSFFISGKLPAAVQGNMTDRFYPVGMEVQIFRTCEDSFLVVSHLRCWKAIFYDGPKITSFHFRFRSGFVPQRKSIACKEWLGEAHADFRPFSSSDGSNLSAVWGGHNFDHRPHGRCERCFFGISYRCDFP